MNSTDAWPVDVVEHARKRNLILIVGAGVSAASTNDERACPPNWVDLLRNSAEKISMAARKSELDALLEQGRLLEAAELLRFDASERSRTQDLHQAIVDAVDGPQGHPFQANPWHEAIVAVEPNVIVTTNFDKIIERATSSGYNVHSYTSSGVAADIRRSTPVLLKIHGSRDQVEDLVLSRRDFTQVRKRVAHVFEVLHALLLTRPALFIGYGLRDPDLQLVLENVLGGRGETPPHYMLASDDMPDYERRVLEHSYGVTPIRFAAGNYDDALSKFGELADVVSTSPLGIL